MTHNTAESSRAIVIISPRIIQTKDTRITSWRSFIEKDRVEFQREAFDSGC